VEKGCENQRQECLALNRHQAEMRVRMKRESCVFILRKARSGRYRAGGTAVKDCCVLAAEGGVIIKGTNPHET
jgi:hypothetical protein